VPNVCRNTIGCTHPERATTMIRDLVYNTRADDGELVLQMSDEVFAAMATLREFLYEKVYRAPKVHNEFVKAKKILIELYNYFSEHVDELEVELNKLGMGHCNHIDQPRARWVCDFIASLTDSHAMDLYEQLFFPSPLMFERGDFATTHG
jgi:dGTPase